MISIRQLEWRHGPFSRKLWTLLLAALAQRTIRCGRNVRLRHMSDGVVVRGIGGKGGGDVSASWQMSVEDGEDDSDVYWLLRVSRGLVNGTEAQINGTPMSKIDPDTGDTPALKVTKDEFGEDSICRIYAQIAVSKEWEVDHVDVVALAKTPAKTAWTDFMLIGFLLTDEDGEVSVEQHRFFDQQWVAANTKSTGYATYLRGAE